ncbi:MAG: hypothetical protein ACRDOO_24165 [Actinomadura sp.]
MGNLGDELVSLAVAATSPDGQIRAMFGDQGEKVEIAFQPGAYRDYSETSLAHELSRLAMRVTASYVRAQKRLIDDAIPDVLHDDGIEYGLEDREYRRRVAAIKAGAKSPDGRIAVASQSLARWKVRIADGTVRRVSEETFKEGFLGAIREVLAQHQFEVLKLKDEYYDLGYSNETRRRMGLPERRGSR